MAANIDGLDDDNYSDDDDDVRRRYNGRSEPSDSIYLTSDGHCDRIVLMSVLAPIGHTYLAVAFSLNSLLGTCMIESEFIKLCVNEITSKVDEGECKFGK